MWCCSSCLEPTASQRLAWGSPAEPAAAQAGARRSRLRPLEEIQGAQDAAGMGSRSALLSPPWIFAWPKWQLGSLPNLSAYRVLLKASPGPPPHPPASLARVLYDGLRVQLNLKMGCQAYSAFFGLIVTSVPNPKLVTYSLAKESLEPRSRTALWLNDKAPSTGSFEQIPP